MKIRFAGATDVGQVRTNNEDNFAVLTDRNLMVVCDGMGGHAAGEVASGIAAETIVTLFAEHDLKVFTSERFVYPEEITPEGKLLVGAIAVANTRIHDRSRSHPELAGMGTTVVACQFKDGVVSICHAGDSRGYLMREGSLKQITIDHSLLNELMEKYPAQEEESKNFVNANVITRALGTKPSIKVDISEIAFKEGDLFLLCSDGLSGMVTDSQLLETVSAHPDNPDQLITALIDLANAAGGADNITVCVARIDEQKQVDEFEEVRRVTLHWGEGPEADDIHQIADSKFDSDAVSSPGTSDAVTDVSPPTAKKKSVRIWSYLLIVIILALLVILGRIIGVF
ncbi:MAG: Stp1/IreP family PP2C-type Ser/Thr phosphatase [candidate division Zixibacteria bacterium]|nr:Stp1/IreP family PP2C-type Ser/Thr phosphatase [candidate division Zixibacteria bacterium]